MEVKECMKTQMLKTMCVIASIAGSATLATRADDPPTAPAQAGSQTTTPTTEGDHFAKSFIKQAAQDNQTEIDLAGVGIAKAQNEKLKAFCLEVQRDHAQANKDLQPIAQKYAVPEETAKRGEREANKLEKENSGPEFDKKLATELLKGHQKGISTFERATSKLQDADVRQYAENMLPKFREHLLRAETVAREVGVDESTIMSIMSKATAARGITEKEELGAGTEASRAADQGFAAKQPQPTLPSGRP
jgi:putative membrane protein